MELVSPDLLKNNSSMFHVKDVSFSEFLWSEGKWPKPKPF